MRSSLNCTFPLLAVVAIAIAGCVTPIQQPTPADLDKVKKGQLTAMFFQIKPSIDGKAVSLPEAGMRAYLAKLSEHTAPTPAPMTSPSEAAMRDGWYQLFLAPGTYYLLVLPPGIAQNPPATAFHAPIAKFGRLTQYKFEPGRGGSWSPNLQAFTFPGAAPPDFREVPGFWFEVPKEKSVVYLGTLSISCVAGRGLLGDLIGSCSDYEITANSQGAQRLATAEFPGLDAVDVEALALYGKTRDGKALRERGSINVVVPTSTKLGVAYTGAQLGPWGVVHGASQTVGVFNLLAILGEVTHRAIAEEDADQRAAAAQPCIQQLAKTVPGINYAGQFTSAFSQAARARGSALEISNKRELATSGQSDRARYQLVIAAPLLQLRESATPKYLSLELGLHVRLENSETKSVAYESLLVYGEAFPNQFPFAQGSRLYERLLPERSQPRPTSEWCGPSGAALLQKEIQTGLEQIATQLARDLD